MIAGQPKTGTLANSIMSARCFEPFAVTTRDGRPARIAIIDDQGSTNPAWMTFLKLAAARPFGCGL